MEFHNALETSGSVGKNSGWIPFPIVAKSEGKDGWFYAYIP